MKKAITIIIGFFAIVCFSNNVYAAAATWAQTSAGTQVTVGSTGSTGDFSFNPSPGVLVTGASDITVYCILTGNSKAAADAIVYNVWSAGGQVAQKAVDLSTSTTLGTAKTDGSMAATFATKQEIAIEEQQEVLNS